MSGKMAEKMQEGVALAEKFLSTPRVSFQYLKPSDLPAKPGVHAIFCKDTEEALYVGRTENIKQRLYSNHLHGPFTNAKLKKYLAEAPMEKGIPDITAAKQYLLNCCYFQFVVGEDTMESGRLEGLLSYLFNVRYMYEEH